MYELPTSVTVKEQSWKIRNRGDYRVILDCFSCLDDQELSEQERLFSALIIFYEDMEDIEDLYRIGDLEEAIKQMFLFFNCGEEETQGADTQHKVIDWEQDSLLICSAVNNVARTEIRALEYLHWWTFMSYYYAIGECSLSTIVGIRHKIVTGKKLEKYEQDFKRDNPQYFTWNSSLTKKKELDEYVRSIWNQE